MTFSRQHGRFIPFMRWSLVQECLATADFSSSSFSQLVLLRFPVERGIEKVFSLSFVV